MKALNHKEILCICNELSKSVGCQLQLVSSQENKIYLRFWDGVSHTDWLLDLNNKAPVLLPTDKQFPKKNIKKPWISFLTMHFINSVLQSVSVLREGERTLVLTFKSFERGDQKITVNIFPRGLNLILNSQGKQVSMFKVKDFPALNSPYKEVKVRTVKDLVEEYQSKKQNQSNKEFIDPKKEYDKKVNKVKKSIDKVSIDIESKKNKIRDLKKVGDYIKLNLNLDLDERLLRHIDLKKSVIENMSTAFSRYKKESNKISGVVNRLEVLNVELSNLLQVTDYNSWYKNHNKNTSNVLKLKKDQKLKFKTIQLPGDKLLLLGGSAKNNSELIKAAKPWYIWLHLRDYPSTHGVIVYKKKEEVKRDTLLLAARELVKFNFKSKQLKYQGIKFDIIYCEVRYLKPVKGSIGKVTYINDKNILVQM